MSRDAGQNTSSAVMQQRSEPHDSLDDFPTPPWATRALCERMRADGLIGPAMTVREPAANRGYMARPLAEYFAEVRASDIHDYGAGFPVDDFLFGLPGDGDRADWTITNPPFRLAQAFIERAIAESRVGVAVILRSAFVEGVARHAELFSVNPPSLIYQFAERVPMVKGRYDPKASTATAYLWLVWLASDDWRGETRFRWIPPCRRHLERPGDADWDSCGNAVGKVEASYECCDDGLANGSGAAVQGGLATVDEAAAGIVDLVADAAGTQPDKSKHPKKQTHKEIA